jgi:hypothetical protein
MIFFQFLLLYPAHPECVRHPRRQSRILLLTYGVSVPHPPDSCAFVLIRRLRYGIVVLFLDEARKWWIRGHKKSLLAKVAW